MSGGYFYRAVELRLLRSEGDNHNSRRIDPDDPEDNRAFVFDRHNATAKSYEFRGGRFIRPDYLATAVTEGIPDKMGAVPLCAVKDRRAAAAGELLLAEKQPNHSQDAPYCYRIHYVVR